MTIAFTKTKLPFGWMGNMSPFPIEYNGQTWKTVEALFQALRFDDLEIREAIRLEKSPMGAKFKAKAFAEKMVILPTLPHDVSNMEMLLYLKLDQHPQLKELLKATGEELIVEDVTKRPSGRNSFWGAALINDEWVGENTLGKLWMKIRNQQTKSLWEKVTTGLIVEPTAPEVDEKF